MIAISMAIGESRVTALKTTHQVSATVLVKAPCPSDCNPKMALAKALREIADAVEGGNYDKNNA